jgi:hypothetical protein
MRIFLLYTIINAIKHELTIRANISAVSSNPSSVSPESCMKNPLRILRTYSHRPFKHTSLPVLYSYNSNSTTNGNNNTSSSTAGLTFHKHTMKDAFGEYG